MRTIKEQLQDSPRPALLYKTILALKENNIIKNIIKAKSTTKRLLLSTIILSLYPSYNTNIYPITIKFTRITTVPDLINYLTLLNASAFFASKSRIF